MPSELWEGLRDNLMKAGNRIEDPSNERSQIVEKRMEMIANLLNSKRKAGDKEEERKDAGKEE